MTTTGRSPAKVDRRLVGEPIQVDGRSVQPVARVSGRVGSGGSGYAGGGGGQVSIEPVEAIVREASGAQSTLVFADPGALALRKMAVASLAVAAISLVISLLLRLKRR